MIRYWFRKLADKLEEKAGGLEAEGVKWRRAAGINMNDFVQARALRTLAEALREVAGE